MVIFWFSQDWNDLSGIQNQLFVWFCTSQPPPRSSSFIGWEHEAHANLILNMTNDEQQPISSPRKYKLNHQARISLGSALDRSYYNMHSIGPSFTCLVPELIQM